MKEKTFVSAVVYVYNAEQVIAEFLHNLDRFLDSKFEIFEIILVNDCSTDGTKKVVKEVAPGLKGTLSMVNLAWRHKREQAMLAGADLAIGDFIYELESTRPNYDMSVLGALYDKSVTGYDVVLAFPKKTKKVGSRVFYWLLNRLSYLNIEERTETAKIVSRKALNRVLLERSQVRYRKVLYKHCGYPTSFYEYNPVRDISDKEEMTLVNKLGLAFDVFIVFSNLGIHVAMLFSVLFFLLSGFIGIYALIVKISGHTQVSGWTTTMLFLSIGFSGLFLSLTVMAKYISTILLEQRQKSIYTVAGIDKLTTKVTQSYKEE